MNHGPEARVRDLLDDGGDPRARRPLTAGRPRGCIALAALLLCMLVPCARGQTMDRSAGGMNMRPSGPGGMWGGVERDPAASPAERLFRSGRLPGDRSADADRAGNPVGADQVACANCHGRSGQGIREGGQSAPPIHAAALAAARSTAPTRPAYDRASLARAISDGLDAGGRPLGLLMPRYHLEAEAMDGLAAYLQQLRPRALAATDDTSVRVATVISGEVDPGREAELTATLRAYAADAAARAPAAGRRWRLEVWHLHGSANERRAQLEAAYAAMPVAALLGGLGDDSWLAVHQFCEQRALPCLFPHTDLPPIDVPAFYSAYLDKGRTLSAQVLARHLRDHPGVLERGPLVQVLPANWAGYTPASALRAYLGRVAARKVHDLTIAAGQPLDAAFWRKVLDAERPAALVLWTPGDGLAGLTAALADGPGVAVFIPVGAERAALETASAGVAAVPGGGALQLHLLAHHSPPVAGGDLAAWRDFLGRQGALAEDCAVCADAWFAARVFDDALSEQTSGIVDTDRLMSRVEYAAGTVVRHPLRPDLALGMGQRFAGKSGWLLMPSDSKAHAFTVESGPITP